MRPHQERVIEEAEQLLDRITKLRNFIVTNTFDLLHIDERNRLHAQVAAMTDYHNILRERIQHF